MNYPIWDQPAAGLIIAGIAIVHVFISHFAVGGGLFLVVTERKARREGDAALLDYVRRHSRFFILLTLVLGAMTGVGIWFAIALVHPQGTSSLINTFVWGWAIEWTLFITEIAAALVYYYGWERLSPATHLRVGWIYFACAWLSLVVINGILTYMMTPGAWPRTRGMWDGFFNETYWPSLLTRTFVAIGLAGIYALLTLSFRRDPELKAKVARYAGLYWVLPMAVALPLGLVWYLSAAMRAGVPAGEILGAGSEGVGAVIAAVLGGPGGAGYPTAQRGAWVAIAASVLVLAITLTIALFGRRSFGPFSTVPLLALGLLAFGGGEWVREDLRKPYLIGRYMFVNAVRLPAPAEAPRPPDEAEAQMADRFEVEALGRSGVLGAALWAGPPEGFDPRGGPSPALGAVERAELESRAGRQVFHLLCFQCHTTEGYQAMRPLVAGQSPGALEKVLTGLARPVNGRGEPARWDDPDLRLQTRLGRRMPPFVGTDAERRALAVYLARLGGMPDAGVAVADSAGAGAKVFDENCSMCHGEGSDWPIEERVRGFGAEQLYELLDRLPKLNEMMPEFEGTEEERRALAEYLAGIGAAEVER